MAAEDRGQRTVRLKDGTVLAFPAEEGDEMDFAAVLRKAIQDAGVTQYHLAKLTGVPQAAISTFMAGKDLRLSTFNKLAATMGFELKQNRTKAPRRKR